MIKNTDNDLKNIEERLQREINKEEIQKIIKFLENKLNESPNNLKIINFLIIAYFKMSLFENVVLYCNKSINLINTDPNIFYTKAVALLKLNSLEEAVVNFNKTINLEKKHYLSYFFLGNIMWENHDIEKAIEFYHKCLSINSSFTEARSQLKKIKKEKMDLITYLTYFNPDISTANQIIVSNQELQKIKYKFDKNKKISDDFIINLYQKMIKVLNDNKINSDIEASQIHRESKIKYYNCIRHFEVFDTFNIIPNNCFTCYKIQIQPRDIIELIKLYIVFDNLDFNKNLTRKCMVEFRSNVKSPYKGFIYCIGLEEAERTIEYLSPILDRTIDTDLPRFIKRGCSEFSISYPNFSNINSKNNNFMYYDPKWKKKEQIIDDKISKRKRDEIIKEETLRGVNLKDVLIINNWLNYARLINDISYKSICSEPPFSKYINEKLDNDLINKMRFN